MVKVRAIWFQQSIYLFFQQIINLLILLYPSKSIIFIHRIEHASANLRSFFSHRFFLSKSREISTDATEARDSEKRGCRQVDRQIAFSSAEVAFEIGLPSSKRGARLLRARIIKAGFEARAGNEPRAKARPAIIGAGELHGLVACIWSGNRRKTKWCSCWESREHHLAADPSNRDTFLTKPTDSSNLLCLVRSTDF